MLATLAATAALLASAAAVRDCSTRAEGGEQPTETSRDGDVVLGPLAFTGLTHVASAGGIARSRSRRGYVVKAGALARADARVTLAIGASARDWAWLVYAPGSAETHAVRFRACPFEEPAFSYDGPVGIVTGFPGGFRVTRPGCVPLELRRPGRATLRKRVPFGVARC
jgi:hypothetical protein